MYQACSNAAAARSGAGLAAGQLVQQRAQAQLVEVAAQLVQPRQLPGRVLVGGQRREPRRRGRRAAGGSARISVRAPLAVGPAGRQLVQARRQPRQAVVGARPAASRPAGAAASLSAAARSSRDSSGPGSDQRARPAARSARRSRRPSPAPSPAAAASRAGSASQTPGAQHPQRRPHRGVQPQPRRALGVARRRGQPGLLAGLADAVDQHRQQPGAQPRRPGRRPARASSARAQRRAEPRRALRPHHEPAQVRELPQLVADLVGQLGGRCARAWPAGSWSGPARRCPAAPTAPRTRVTPHGSCLRCSAAACWPSRSCRSRSRRCRSPTSGWAALERLVQRVAQVAGDAQPVPGALVDVQRDVGQARRP